MGFTRRHLPAFNAVAGIAGLSVAVASMFALGAGSTAQAATNDGSDWGAQGSLTSDSAVTVRWDNVGNNPDSTVHRDSRQKLPHTNNKTYASVAAATRAAYAADFGADNGLGGLSVTVSQTTNLVNQGIEITATGAKGGNPSIGANSSELQVFQCWGAPGADGKPDPDASSPDPTTCQYGVGGSDGKPSSYREQRTENRDPLARDAEWASDPSNIAMPFTALSGESAVVDDATLSSKFFSNSTTNELNGTAFPATGRLVRQFEAQTGSEASGLGCGYRSDAPSVSDCWLVIVPRVEKAASPSTDEVSPLAPSIWAQRMQVKLSFQDVAPSCPSGQAQLLIGGSEMLSSAMASWTPAVCDTKKVALGYSVVGDGVARNQYTTGSSDAILTSEPLSASAKATYVPVALAAPVIGMVIDYQPRCDDVNGQNISLVTTDAEAVTCGYEDLATLKADYAKTGSPITDLRLDARLVAKLLTQSYFEANLGAPVDFKKFMPTYLFNDPEFQALNPQLRHMRASDGISYSVEAALVEAARSDAASAVWNWILADADARGFLSGCPDDNDNSINPFYSTRTYDGCQYRAKAYEKAAKSARDAVKKPAGYVDEALSYPPEGSPYPQPDWHQQVDQNGKPPRTQGDYLPRVDSMALTARYTFTAIKPRNSDWCDFATDSSCAPAPGKWKDPKIPQKAGARTMIAITDTASAARYRLPTASLCDSSGASCVGANIASLQKAASNFEATPVAGVQQPDQTPDYAGGAYPLTLPVYAAINAKELTEGDRAAFGDALDFVTTTAQTSGFDVGDLPPGYAPLTADLRAQAAASIALVRNPPADPSPTPTATPTPTSTPTPTKSASTAPSTPKPTATTKPTPKPTKTSTPVPTTAPSVTPTTPASVVPVVPAPVVSSTTPATTGGGTTVAATAITPVTDGTWPKYALPTGLGLALASGVFAPFLRRRTTITLQTKAGQDKA